MKNVYKRKINMNTKELRRYITENIKNRRDDNIDLDFIGSEYTDIGSNHMHGFFNMVLIADMAEANVPIAEARDKMAALGEEIGVEIRLQSEEIFSAMHRI